MKNKHATAKLQLLSISILIPMIFQSCQTTVLSPNQSKAIADSVRKTVDLIAKDNSSEGPLAWLKYFENDSGFFMASEGRLVFPNHDSATVFIKNILVKSLKKIELRWSDVRVDPLTRDFANIAAGFHEDLTDFNGETTHEDGYFTAVAEHTGQGWKLRNAHWSVVDK